MQKNTLEYPRTTVQCLITFILFYAFIFLLYLLSYLFFLTLFPIAYHSLTVMTPDMLVNTILSKKVLLASKMVGFSNFAIFLKIMPLDHLMPSSFLLSKKGNYWRHLSDQGLLSTSANQQQL